MALQNPTYKVPTQQVCPRCGAFYVKERIGIDTWKFTCSRCKYVEWRYEHAEDKSKIANIPAEDKEVYVTVQIKK